jgi:carbon storage regulator
MLVLSRKTDESFVIGGNIVVTIVEVKGKRVRLGVAAPRTVRVLRQELMERAGRSTPPPARRPAHA